MALQAVSLTSADLNGSWPVKTKKPYIRVITEKRREQNRRAQKIYRDKVRRKVESLEEQIASNVPEKLIEVSNPTETASDPDIRSTSFSQNAAASNVLNFEDILTSAGDLSIPDGTSMPNFQYPKTPPPLPPSELNLSDKSDSQFLDFEAFPNPYPWQIPCRPTTAVSSPPSNSTSSHSSNSLTTIPPHSASIHQKRRLDRQIRVQPRSHPLPSPQLNTLTLTYESNLQASLAIGLHLGITRSSYLEDKPSMFPSCFAQLWYSVYPIRWTATCEARFRAGRLEIAPREIQDHMSRIKEPLRPRPVQMLDAHPSYLDCIVFPKLRERATQASAEGRLNHVEFFLDLMHGGLVCWGSAGPKRGRRRRGMADQVVWSTRSWEARRWFLEKWMWLIGTEEEEEEEGDRDGVWGCSRWWWEVRGEVEESDDEEEYEGEGERAKREGLVQGHEGSNAFDMKGLSYNWS